MQKTDGVADGTGVVIPTYRESENIGSLIREILRVEPAARIVVVDDSPDLATVAAVEALALPRVSVVHRAMKDGRGSAVLEGMRQLLSDGCGQIVEMDADFSHPPGQMPELLREATERGLDMLIASRYLPRSEIHNWPLSRRLFSRGANALARRVLGIPVRDYTNGYRVYDRAAAELVVKTCGKLGKGFIPLSEILVNLHCRDFRVGETPTIFLNRVRGESSVNFVEVRNAITGLFKISRLRRSLERARVRRT